MRTHLTRYRPTSRRPHREPLPEGWQLVVITEAPAEIQDMWALACLHRDLYVGQHTWDPPIAFPDDLALDLCARSLGGEPLPENTVIALRHGVPIGVGSLRADASSVAMDLGWIGVLTHAGEDGSLVSMALTDWCLDRAIELGVDLDIEIDDANAPVLKALGAWDIAWESKWLTFARDRRSTANAMRSSLRR